ncbi:hypothetical protein DBV05_g7085 [Lasiodiplodia theobromae]|uniref:Uncharacterized protein n=1 Tax=Lasiodiplodia theobromae TaxID=45133 RepID=A0A5N5D8Y6_9PEZI|nr:hypothetical protein DBV05_g7085 [Lasiodiplodia theobromae]
MGLVEHRQAPAIPHRTAPPHLARRRPAPAVLARAVTAGARRRPPHVGDRARAMAAACVQVGGRDDEQRSLAVVPLPPGWVLLSGHLDLLPRPLPSPEKAREQAQRIG